MIQLFTSNFFVTKGNPNAVSISRGKPTWYNGRTYDQLAPQYAWFKYSKEEFRDRYQMLLDDLDPIEVMNDLGDGSIMLCWEPFNVLCHRRMVAEWIERETGIIVPEWQRRREESLPYMDQPTKDEAKAASEGKRGPGRGGLTGQSFLF